MYRFFYYFPIHLLYPRFGKRICNVTNLNHAMNISLTKSHWILREREVALKCEDLCLKFTEERKKTRNPISFFQQGNLGFDVQQICEIWLNCCTKSCTAWNKSLTKKAASEIAVHGHRHVLPFLRDGGFPVENWRNSFHALSNHHMFIAFGPFDLWDRFESAA